ncbi:MAG: creatininase family protein [Armatimonadetes bacterium]|nr:creatininase family protein [Armatimonadota bacterium]
MRNVDYAGMFVKEFREALAENPTAWVPIGLLEWHGEHIALGCDLIGARESCRLLARTYGGIVLPPTYFSRPGFSAYEGTIDFPLEVAAPTLTALLQQLEKVGFKTAVLLSFHGGSVQEKMLALAREEYEKEGSIRVVTVIPFTLVAMPETSSHATPVETAVLRALCPEAVDVSRFTPAKEYPGTYELPGRSGLRTWRITDVDVRNAPLDAYAEEFLGKLVERVGRLLDPTAAPDRE